MEFNFTSSIPKIRTIIDTVTTAIMQGQLSAGQSIPSINELSSAHGISRDTVFKAYGKLKKSGLIDSMPTKGYFVKGAVNRILMLLDTYSPFKQDLYNRFVGNLPENFKVDLVFHQYNRHFFDMVIRDSIGMYSMYLVMSLSNDEFSDTLKSIPQGKLLLLDFGNFEKSSYSYICQDFGQSFYNCLQTGVDKISKYKKFVFLFPEELCHPKSSIEPFRKFCDEQGLEAQIIRKNTEWRGIEKEAVYLAILHEDLVKIIKSADHAGLKITKDYGLIAYNEDSMLEIIKEGISSISIDFGRMGEMAAEFVSTQQRVQEYLPTVLNIRNSI